ncbi:MAG: hypothetical protein ACRD0J_06750 [Acidimicrobiales bacterium]
MVVLVSESQDQTGAWPTDPDISAMGLGHAAMGPDRVASLFALSDPHCPVGALVVTAHHGGTAERLAVVSNPAAPTALLDALCADPDPRVRRAAVTRVLDRPGSARRHRNAKALTLANWARHRHQHRSKVA